jgi:hypothetical protein
MMRPAIALSGAGTWAGGGPRDGEGNLTNVEYKAICHCHNELYAGGEETIFIVYSYMLIK